MASRVGGSAPGGGRSLAVALAAVVVTLAVVAVVGLVALVLLDDGWTRVVWAAIGALLLWQLVPRPARPSAHVMPLGADEAPSLHRLVAEVADAASARRPDSIAVDTTDVTSLVPVGYLGRTTLVVALPQWTALDSDERIAGLAHVLACAHARSGAAGILFRLADDLLTRLVLLLSPTGSVQPHETAREQSDSGMGALGAGDELAGDRFRREVAASVGAAGLSVVAAPARALQRLLRRAARPSSTRSCLAADREAAALVGAPAVVGLLLSTLPPPRATVAAQVAARRGLDPFAAICDAERPAADELARRLATASSSGGRTGPDDAPTAARVEALGAGDVVVTRGVGPAAVRAADTDLERCRRRLARRYAEELVHGRS
jgi:hypothetical protein